MKKIKTNQIVEVIDFMLSIPESIADGFLKDHFKQALFKMPRERILSTRKISDIFHQLKRGGYIEIVHNDNGTESIRFTNKSRLAVIDQYSSRAEHDSINRFISFDIPERLRVNRNHFRRVIKRLGFKQIQKSLWVCNKQVGEMVELAAKEYKINDYVIYIAADKTNIDTAIHRLFKHGKF